jgi:hypothetical protein
LSAAKAQAIWTSYVNNGVIFEPTAGIKWDAPRSSPGSRRLIPERRGGAEMGTPSTTDRWHSTAPRSSTGTNGATSSSFASRAALKRTC